MSGFDFNSFPSSLGQNADLSGITVEDAKKAFKHLDDKQIADLSDKLDNLRDSLASDRQYLENVLQLVGTVVKVVLA